MSLTAALTPERLGAGTTLTLAFAIATTSGMVPSPLTRLDLLYPNNFGIATSGLGTTDCTAKILEHQGPAGCPPDSQIGSGTALAVIPIGPEILSETATTTIFMAPIHSGHTTLLFDAIGETTPVAAQIVFTGRLLPAQQPFGGELYTTIPLVPTLPEAPDAAVVRLRSTIGPLHLTYYRHTHGRPIAYHPKGILLPPTCPSGGFQFAARLHFHDGTHTNAHTTVPCPRSREHSGAIHTGVQPDDPEEGWWSSPVAGRRIAGPCGGRAGSVRRKVRQCELAEPSCV